MEPLPFEMSPENRAALEKPGAYGEFPLPPGAKIVYESGEDCSAFLLDFGDGTRFRLASQRKGEQNEAFRAVILSLGLVPS